MAKDVIHISEAEVVRDIASLLVRVRAGAEVVIEDDARQVTAVLRAEPSVRLISESLRLAREHASTSTLDADFAKDVEAGIESHRQPLDPPAWD
jgi:antitoxin (DNA-binding transcriptional repressor) of toxin-antitoxin stability system